MNWRYIDMNKENKGYARNLKSRHIQLIALGGTIGTGLFLGSGSCPESPF